MNEKTDKLDIFLSTVPGFEKALAGEVRDLDFGKVKETEGGVSIKGSWTDVWRANLVIRGASHVLVRVASFRVNHLAQLDKLAHNISWDTWLHPDQPFRVEATCRKSRIYHSTAAAERVSRAISDITGGSLSDDAPVCIKVRLVKDLCTISIDTSGEPLHRRGHKAELNKAPMRENLASLILRASAFRGQEPLVDPMCGSGTFVIEAAEIARKFAPGRSRSFAFEQLASFDEDVWKTMKSGVFVDQTDLAFHGFDRDAGGIRISAANAARAGVADNTLFKQQTISDVTAPDGPPGLVVINPPYGTRIGDRKKLLPLYQTLGKRLTEAFPGWRVSLITASGDLAGATGLPFKGKPLNFSHGGLKVALYRTGPLPSAD